MAKCDPLQDKSQGNWELAESLPREEIQFFFDLTGYYKIDVVAQWFKHWG